MGGSSSQLAVAEGDVARAPGVLLVRPPEAELLQESVDEPFVDECAIEIEDTEDAAHWVRAGKQPISALPWESMTLRVRCLPSR